MFVFYDWPFPHTCTLTKNVPISLLILGSVFSDCVVFYGDLNEARDNGVLGCSGISWTIMQTICTSLQTDNHTNTSSLNFYRLDALPDAQPTVSKP